MALIAMKRGTPMREGGPTTANVDSSDVDSWRKVGWELCETVKNAPKVDLDEMTIPELRALAKDNGVNIPAALKDRAKIVAALSPAIEGKSGPLD